MGLACEAGRHRAWAGALLAAGHTRRAEAEGRGFIVARRGRSCCGCIRLTTDGGTHDSLGLSPPASPPGLPL